VAARLGRKHGAHNLNEGVIDRPHLTMKLPLVTSVSGSAGSSKHDLLIEGRRHEVHQNARSAAGDGEVSKEAAAVAVVRHGADYKG